MPRLKVFISSAQKELADERMAMQILLSTDSFLQKHTVPRLFEYTPAPLTPNKKEYLSLLHGCNICIVILGSLYGPTVEDSGLSATHEEYRLAKELRLPILVCLKGDSAGYREPNLDKFLGEIKADGFTYSRFKSLDELQKHARERLIEHVKNAYDVSPSEEDNRNAEQNIAVADLFERQMLDNIEWKDLDFELARKMIAAAEEISPEKLAMEDVREQLLDRGYLWLDGESGTHYATSAGILLLANNPSKAFPHARIQSDAYAGNQRTARADDHVFLHGPITAVLDDAMRFVHRNTRHPLRVVGLQRINVDEYPETALREAMVNAIVHRDYKDAGVKVVIEVFHDRIVVTNPGLPPGGQSLNRIAAGHGRSRSRNPLLAQGLTWLKAMEDRGTGIMRMTNAMIDHGLNRPSFSLDDGCVVVTLFGPGDDMDRIRLPGMQSQIAPSVEKALTERQKELTTLLLSGQELTSQWCQERYRITRQAVNKDFKILCSVGIARMVGAGRAVRYVAAPMESSTNRQPKKR